MPVKKADTNFTIQIPELEVRQIELGIIGNTPFICNRLSEKAKHELLLPGGRKTAADKAGTLKHDPIAEFQASPYMLTNSEEPTLLALMASSFKKAMMTAALDIPGATKTQIGRLMYVDGYMLPLWGEPRLFSTITRSADINHTPDVRTRAILPVWACKLTLNFSVPMLNETTVANLLSAAGLRIGVGDWRPEKGSGTFGQFRICQLDDEDFTKILKDSGRHAQEIALKEAAPYDADTEELLSWFGQETGKRGLKPTA